MEFKKFKTVGDLLSKYAWKEVVSDIPNTESTTEPNLEPSTPTEEEKVELMPLSIGAQALLEFDYDNAIDEGMFSMALQGAIRNVLQFFNKDITDYSANREFIITYLDAYLGEKEDYAKMKREMPSLLYARTLEMVIKLATQWENRRKRANASA